MGTQFTSRYTKSDRQRILEGIETARKSVTPTKPGRPAAIESLSPAQVRKIGDETVGQVLAVANTRGFLSSFGQSTLFEDVLTWLKRLWNDASFNGFKKIREQYSLDAASSPVPVLTNKLKELTDRDMSDPFRVAASTAAKAVLVEAVSFTRKPDETQAQAFGRKLGSFHVRDIVTRYINSFIYEVLSKSIRMADPENTTGVVQDAIKVSAGTVERIARKVVKRIDSEGKLCDVKRTHEIIVEEVSGLIRL